MLDQLQRITTATRDPAASALLAGVRSYSGVRELDRRWDTAFNESSTVPRFLLVPCILNLPQGRLSLFAMFAMFATLGSPLEVTLAELTFKLYCPTDEASVAVLRNSALAASSTGWKPTPAGCNDLRLAKP